MKGLSFARALVLGVVAFVLPGCGGGAGLMTPEDLDSNLPVIVHLETRDHIVTVMAGPEGRVYAIRTRGGRILDRCLSERQLQVQEPHLHHLLMKSYAGSDPADVMWAGMLTRE